MALKLDNSLIEELGLGALPEHEKQLLLRQIYEKLEMNVGVRLADQMSNEQLDEFEKFVDANDDKGAFQWLETNFPNYKDVVNEEFEKLKAEIKQYAPQMLAVAQHNSQQAVAGGAAPVASQAGAGAPNGQYPPQFPPAGQPNPYQPAPQPSYGQPLAPQYGPAGPATQPAGGFGQPMNPMGPAPAGGPYGQPNPYYTGPQPVYGQPPMPGPAGQPGTQPFGAPQPFPGPTPGSPARGASGAAQPSHAPYPYRQPPAGPGSQPSQSDTSSDQAGQTDS